MLGIGIGIFVFVFNETVTVENTDEEIIVYRWLTQGDAKSLFLEILSENNHYRSVETTADVSLEEMDYAHLQNKIQRWCDDNPDIDNLRYTEDVPRFVLWCYTN